MNYMFFPVENQDPILSAKNRLENKIIRLTNERNALQYNYDNGDCVSEDMHVYRIKNYDMRISTLKNKLETGDYYEMS